MLINIENQLTQTEGIPITYLNANTNAGGTSVPVANVDGFTTQYAVQIAQTGEQGAEILILLGAPPAGSLNFGTSSGNTAGTTLFAHAIDTPVYQIHYDQIVLYRSTAGTGGPFSALGTYNINPANPYTQITDSSGASTYAYYSQYYNSVLGDLSGSSSIFVPGGPTFYSLQKLRQRVKSKLYSAGYIKDDATIDDWINEWYELMQNAAIKTNQAYMAGTNLYTFGTAGLGTVTDPLFKRPLKFEVTYTGGTTFLPSTEVALQDYSEVDYFGQYAPKHAWIGETVFEVLPHAQAGTVKLTYALRFTPLVNDSDELTQTLKAYTTSCVEYALSVAYGLDQKDTESQQHFQVFNMLKQDFIAEVQPRDDTGPHLIMITESTSGMEDDLGTDLGDWGY